MGWVLFFDGECAFCSRSIRLISKLDSRAAIDFAPLQGELAVDLGLTQYADKMSGTMVLLNESTRELYFRSDVIVQLAEILGGGWRVFLLLKWIPRTVRDAGYSWIARNRDLLSRLGPACSIPDEQLRKKVRR